MSLSMDELEEFLELVGTERQKRQESDGICTVYVGNGQFCNKPAVWRAEVDHGGGDVSVWCCCQFHRDVEVIDYVKWRRL